MPESRHGNPGADVHRVGVIGLGRMGGAMAARLMDAGHNVSGFDVSADAVERFTRRGGQAVNSPALAAEGADVLLVMVHDAAQTEGVLFGGTGAAARLSPGSVVWLASTVPPGYATELAARLDALGVALVDGPVSGGATGAQDGDLVAICGAAPQVLGRAAFALEACCRQVHHVGAAGMGSTVKMINQLLVAAHSALTSEAMALAARAGVDLAQFIDVITQSAGNSRIFEKRAPRIAAGDHAVHVSIDTLRKDLAIVIDTAHELGLQPAVALGVQGVLDAAAAAGHGSDSDTRLVQAYLGTRK